MLSAHLEMEPWIARAMVINLVDQMTNKLDGMDRLLDSGVPSELLDQLRSTLTLAEMSRMAPSTWTNVFEVTINPTALKAALDCMRRIIRDEKMKEYLAQHGASSELLCKWFSLSRSEADELRAAMKLLSPGRTKLPDIEVRDKIHAAWRHIRQVSPGLSEREAYCELHQRFSSVSVASLYLTIIEHDPVPAKVRVPAAA
jgi:hypothetical protein